MRQRKTPTQTPGPGSPNGTIPALREVDPPEGSIRLVWVDPSTLTPNVDNWRIHTDEQKALVGDTIDDPGIRWAGACLFNERTGKLLDGHLRQEHAFQSRLPVPVLVGSWAPEKEAAIMATLDQSTGMARADPAKLLAMCQKAVFPTERASEILRRLSERQGVVFPDDPDKPPGDDPGANGAGSGAPGDDSEARRQELLKKWAVETGSIWHCQSKDGLRIHKFMCGDSASDGDVARIFAGRHADMVVTSPPYAEQRDYDGEMLPWDDLMRGVFSTVPTGPDTQMLVNLGITYKETCLDLYWLDWMGWMKSRGWRPYGWYVWDQTMGLPGDYHGRLAPSHEFVFHFNKNAIDPKKCVPCKNAGDVYRFNHGRSRDDNSNDDISYGDSRAVEPMKIHDSVFRVLRATSRGIAHLHPAIFAVGFAREMIECYSEPGQVIYDPFAGSGTTILACEESGRTGYAAEIHPPYAAIALECLALAGMIPFEAR